MLSVKDRLTISELFARMAYYYDEGNLDALEASFSEKAVMSMQVCGGEMIGPFEDRQNIMVLYRNAISHQNDVRRHSISNVLFETSNDVITAISSLTLFATEKGETKLLITGVYRDKMVVENEG